VYDVKLIVFSRRHIPYQCLPTDWDCNSVMDVDIWISVLLCYCITLNILFIHC